MRRHHNNRIFGLSATAWTALALLGLSVYVVIVSVSLYHDVAPIFQQLNNALEN